MVTPVHKDSLTEYQVALATYLRIISPAAGLFTGSDIKMKPNSRSVRVPDIRVDDYIVDADVARIGADHYSGSEFTSEWKNGLPPIEWRTYSMSRHRSFGFTVFDEQAKYSPIPNLVSEYTGRKMQTTVLRDHDKYVFLAGIQGHMTGKMIARVPSDAIGPATANAHRIACTGNAADYRWIAEPGEDSDNQIQPSFATVTGMYLDNTNPLATVDALTLLFSDNWFDSNYKNSERALVITPALEQVLINYLISQGTGTETALKMLKDGDISGFDGSGYLGTLKGSWKLIKVHPEFLPKVYTDDNLVVDPIADSGTANRTLRQVVALAVYKNAIQTHENFAERRQQDGGTRFKGTEYVQDFSYDVWAIDQLSEGIVPLFLPSSHSTYALLDTSFNRVAARVAAARAQLSVSPVTYPLSGPDVLVTRPAWYDFEAGDPTQYIDGDLTVTDAGDLGHNQIGETVPYDVAALQAQLAAANSYILSDATARANTTAVTLGQLRKFATPTSLWEVTTAGTTAGSQPSIAGLVIGDTVTDGTAVFTRRI